MCRAERASAATRNRSPSSATLKCPATSATCPPPASRGPAYRLRHPAGTVAEHISRKPYDTAAARRRVSAQAAGQGQPRDLVQPADGPDLLGASQHHLAAARDAILKQAGLGKAC